MDRKCNDFRCCGFCRVRSVSLALFDHPVFDWIKRRGQGDPTRRCRHAIFDDGYGQRTTDAVRITDA